MFVCKILTYSVVVALLFKKVLGRTSTTVSKRITLFFYDLDLIHEKTKKIIKDWKIISGVQKPL